jgi:hypothetical protein
MPLVSGFGIAFVCNEKREIGNSVSDTLKVLVDAGPKFLHGWLEISAILHCNCFRGDVNDLLLGWGHEP